jgi:hypothetical protein
MIEAKHNYEVTKEKYDEMVGESKAEKIIY